MGSINNSPRAAVARVGTRVTHRRSGGPSGPRRIRTSKAYDGVIDFDRVTRDPAAPTKFLPGHDSGDHLHPGDAGYKAMGDAVDLALFRAGR